MVFKRPFLDEEPNGFPCKHPREQDNTARESVTVQVSPGDDTLPKPLSGEESLIEAEEKKTIGGDLFKEESNGAAKEFGAGSSYLWVNNSVIDEYVESDAAVYFSVFPNYLDFDRRVRAFVHSDDIYSTLLERSPRKLVPVGPEHQAVVPEWLPYDKSYSDNDQKFIGTCIVPMPDLESLAYYKGGEVRSNCDCTDTGSVRCVRQHVVEARDQLRENLGDMIFEKLGFSEMGEEVAKKWSVEDELAFHEIVQANPSSQAKNFWDPLSAFFLSRKRSDLVSYYFNVFVLQKRAEQNRFDPLNADSDDDEWQRNEETAEDDEGSVVGLVFDRDDPVRNPSDLEENRIEGCENEVEIDAGRNDPKFLNNGDVTTGNVNGDFDRNIRDESCTSYEYQNGRVDVCDLGNMGNDARIVVKSGGHN